MSKHWLFVMLLVSLASCSSQQQTATSEAQYKQSKLALVDPFIGTDGKGKTYPGATVPYGMVQLSPDNGQGGWDWISGYFYPDQKLAGFSHTHLSGTGAGDLYDISFFPQPNWQSASDFSQTSTSFSHDNESASPGYYQVYLPEWQINVELTAGLRTGVQKYHFAQEQNTGVVKLDLGYSRNWDKTLATELKILDQYSIGGYRKSTGWAKDQRVYFYTRFSKPIVDFLLFEDGHSAKQKTVQGIDSKGLFQFALDADTKVEIKTAISSVSVENAKLNMQQDGINKDFSAYRQAAESSWEKVLGQIDIQASQDNQVQFYTALYHSYLAPRVFSDANGQYKGPDGQIHSSKKVPRYSFFSLWDTFRALHPWKTITDPRHTTEMMQSLMAHYREYGLLPVWNFQGNETNMMMGYHAVPVLADAWLKGLVDIDGEQLLTAMKKSANQAEFGLKSYQQHGFVPYDERKWNVSLTLEYAFDDWAIAQVAKALGNMQDYETFSQRAQNYRQHFDPQSGFMRAKDSSGQFRLPFEPLSYHPEDYCEANAWQYNYFVPHDIQGLIELHGGKQGLATSLDLMFTTEQAPGELPEWISGYIGQYVHGNEPAHHVPYLYQYLDQPHKTQQRVRQIMQDLYTTAPDGLCGNEDAGQMSAWYMFSALGFYPVNPVSGQYVLGSPEVERASIKLENGNTFTMIAHNQSPKNVYVEKVSLNGDPLALPYISHQQIMAGGTLEFTMRDSVKEP